MDLFNLTPTATVLSFPENNSFIIDNTPSLSFTVPVDEDGDALHFKVEIAKESSFTNQISGSPFESRISAMGFSPTPPMAEGMGSCSFTLQAPLAEGIYYWRVSAWDGYEYGNVSATRAFLLDSKPPEAPANLLANGSNPSPLQQDSSAFIITWENPAELSGITRYFYKLGAMPKHDFDTTATATATPEFSPRLLIRAERELADTLYIWLKDAAGNLAHQNHAAVILRYYAGSAVRILSPRPGETLSRYVYILSNILPFAIDSATVEYQINSGEPIKIAFPLEDVKGTSQFLHVWKTEEKGEVLLRLTIWRSTQISFSDTVRFKLDPEADIPTAIIFEPRSQAFLRETVSVAGYALARNFSRYTLSLSAKNQELRNPMLITSAAAKGENQAEELFKLRTQDFADGEYTLFLEVENKRGEKKGHGVTITIDNTKPTAKILAPSESDTLGCFAKIQGEANDRNLQSATLLAYQSGSPDSIKLKIEVLNGAFERAWETLGLAGEYLLHLAAQDQAGWTAEDQRTCHVNNPRFEKREGTLRT